MKKGIIVQICFLVVVVVGFSWLFFYLFQQKFPSITLPEITDIVPIQQLGGTPKTNQEKNKNGVENSSTTTDTLFPEDALLIKISNGEIFDYSILPNNEVYYLSTDGRVFQAKQGGDEIVNDQKIESLNTFQRTPDGKRGLVSFGNPKNPSWSLYDFTDKTWRPLQKDISNVAWGENNETLVAVLNADGKRSLIKINLTKNTPQITVLVPNFNLYDISFIYTDKDYIYILEKPSAYYQGSMYAFNVKTKDFRIVFEKEFGLVVRIFDEVIGGIKFSSPNTVTLINNKGEKKQNILLQTIPDKCNAHKEDLYCFSSVQTPTDIILPDDYYKNKFNLVDYFYQINPKTGERKELWQSGTQETSAMDGINPVVLGKYVYFINRYDKSLYRLNMDVLSSQNKNE